MWIDYMNCTSSKFDYFDININIHILLKIFVKQMNYRNPAQCITTIYLTNILLNITA